MTIEYVTPRLLPGRTADTTNGFTIDQPYRVIEREHNLYVVLNDNRHRRSVILNSPSPHIKDAREHCVGWFELTTDPRRES